MWHDLARRAAAHGVPVSPPVPCPVPHSDLANRVAFSALAHPWGRAYLEQGYRAWFVEDLLPGERANPDRALGAVGQDTDAVLAAVDREGVHERLLAQTDTARQLGLFGFPSFVVEDEIFWGDDRLEDAVARACAA
jgi:2-hydroxychromene-2-carboxylate isomerase